MDMRHFAFTRMAQTARTCIYGHLEERNAAHSGESDHRFRAERDQRIRSK